MYTVNRIVLDVLKPHTPNILDFAGTIAEAVYGCEVAVTVTEVDEKTQTTVVLIEGESIEYARVVEVITHLGASIHSIDEVTVVSEGEDNNAEPVAKE